MRLRKLAHACITGIIMSGPIQTALAYEAGDWLTGTYYRCESE